MSNAIFEFKQINASSCCVVGVKNNDRTVLEIPSKDESGLIVKAIGNSAFKNDDSIEEVIVPDSVVLIDQSAFEKCSNLKKVTLPRAMKEIGDHAFKKCNISSLVLPELNTLGYAAFSKNVNGTFKIKNKIKIIKSHAFNECEKLICLLGDEEINKWDKEWSSGVKQISTTDDNDYSIEEKANPTYDIKKDESITLVTSEMSNKQRLYDENIKVNDVKGIVYAKAKKLSFSFDRLIITNIPVLKGVQLSFYQKIIILLLQKGIKAYDLNNLIDTLSNFINVRKACVEDFINYLIKNTYLTFDNEKYTLSQEIHFEIKPELNNAMFAELDTKNADCDKILYLKDLNKCYLEDDFDTSIFSRKGDFTDYELCLKSDDWMRIDLLRDDIKSLLSRYFEKSNIHVKNKASSLIELSSRSKCRMEFDALLQYSYSKEKNVSELFNTVVLNENFLPKKFVDKLAEEYKIDTELPRFLSMKEKFYDVVTDKTTKLDGIEVSLEEAKKKVEPLAIELNDTKESFNTLKKDNKKQVKEANEALTEIEKEIKKKDKEIQTNESAVARKKGSDGIVINYFEKNIKELKQSKASLEDELHLQQDQVAKLESDLKAREQEFATAIKEKEKEVSEAKAEVKKIEKEYKKQSDELSAVLENNKNKINKTIKNVIQKYPVKENIFNRYIHTIVTKLDEALSESENNAVDEITCCIDQIREMYRKVIQIIFDTLLKKKEMNLGSYMGNKYNQLELERLFKARGVNVDIIKRLVVFHEVANAMGHSVENGPKKAMNQQRLNEFKHMSLFDRNRTILALPDFFDTINFTKKEINEFIDRLRIR